MKPMNWQTRMVLGIAGSVAASAAAFIVLAYTRTGRRAKNSPLLPDVLEKQMNKLVGWLDEHFGKLWVDRGMNALEAALKSTPPAYLIDLLEPVLDQHEQSQHKRWFGRRADSKNVGPN